MKTINKLLGAGALVISLGAAGAYAVAQQGLGFGHGRMGMGPGMMMGGPGMGPGAVMGPGMMAGRLGDPAARLATLKTELAIRPEQTADWDAYAKVVTESAAAMKDHREHVDRDAVRNMQPKDRQAFAAAMLKQREENFAKVKAAADALLAKLDDAQKAKAQGTLPGLAAAGPGQGMRHGMTGGGGTMGRHSQH